MPQIGTAQQSGLRLSSRETKWRKLRASAQANARRTNARAALSQDDEPTGISPRFGALPRCAEADVVDRFLCDLVDDAL